MRGIFCTLRSLFRPLREHGARTTRLHVARHSRKLSAESLESRHLLAIFLPTDVFSLAEAIQTAGTNDESDIINLSGRTIVLTEIDNVVDGPNGLPTIAPDNGHPLTIENGLIVRGRPYHAWLQTPRFRLMHVSSGANVTLDRLTLRAGFSYSGNGGGQGGAIYSEASSLDIRNSHLTGNRASLSGGGLHTEVAADGELHIFNTLIDKNAVSVDPSQVGGGGVYIHNFGEATVAYSTITANATLASGGGLHVYSAGQTIVERSTISDNRAGLDGGGLALTGDRHAQTFVIDSTISGNAAERHGGGVVARHDVDIIGSTVTQNQADHIGGYGNPSGGDGVGDGGGLYVQDASLRVNSTILAENRDVWSPETSDLAASPQSSLAINYSLVGVASGNFSGRDNLIGVDPQLEPLADNGGPTRTHALSPSSPAINAAFVPRTGPFASQWDQRGPGFARRLGGQVDIGAYEVSLEYSAPLIVSTTEDEFDHDFSPGDLSLREAVAIANFRSEGRRDAITFDPELFSTPQVIQLTDGQIEAVDHTTINGPGKRLLTIDGQFNSRIFNFVGAGRASVTLTGMTLSRGKVVGSHSTLTETAYDGGAIRYLSKGGLALIDVAIVNSSVVGNFLQGGAVYAVGTVYLENSTLSGNLADGRNTRGGAIYSETSVQAVNSTIEHSYAATGGGIAVDGPATVTDSRLIDNEAAGDGGAVFATSNVYLTRALLGSNTTISRRSRGGGIFSHEDVRLDESTLHANGAEGYLASGGGIYAVGDAIITRSTVSHNWTWGVGGYGGGIYAGQNVVLADSTVAFNKAAAGAIGGGGIAAAGDVTVRRSTITGNYFDHPSGGAAGIDNLGRLDAENSIIAGNRSQYGNPDFWALGGATVQYSLIGTKVIVSLGNGNVVTDQPLLGHLRNNGGPTLTMLPSRGSPAIDAGTPTSLLPAAFPDQRGVPFLRTVGGRIDIGAVETQSPLLASDFNADGTADGGDYLTWQRFLGASDAGPFPGDANRDNEVDARDRAIWESQFGVDLPTPPARIISRDRPAPRTMLLDAAFDEYATRPASLLTRYAPPCYDKH